MFNSIILPDLASSPQLLSSSYIYIADITCITGYDVHIALCIGSCSVLGGTVHYQHTIFMEKLYSYGVTPKTWPPGSYIYAPCAYLYSHDSPMICQKTQHTSYNYMQITLFTQ